MHAATCAMTTRRRTYIRPMDTIASTWLPQRRVKDPDDGEGGLISPLGCVLKLAKASSSAPSPTATKGVCHNTLRATAYRKAILSTHSNTWIGVSCASLVAVCSGIK